MKLLYTGSEVEAIDQWSRGATMQDLIDFIYAHTQVTHDLSEPILVDAQGNTSLITVYNGDGSITMHGPERCDGCNEALDEIEYEEYEISKEEKRDARQYAMERLFDDVFRCAIQSGLLIEKAAAKACEAVEGIEQIEAARNRVVNAQLDKEFGDVQE